MNFKAWYEVFEPSTEIKNVTWYDGETEQPISGPMCNRHLLARFNLGDDTYWIRIDEVDDNSVDLSFGTYRRGISMTGANTPFTALTHVFGVVGQFLKACPRARFTFTGASFSRNRIFSRMIAKLFPNYSQDEEGFYAPNSTAS